jgi:hypothetical protein
MPNIGLTRSPKLQKGALVELVETLGLPVPSVIAFQYNPEKMSRSLTPWNPLDVDPTQRGVLAPTAQPFDPKETISMEIELDASDQLEDGAPVASRVGVADRIAALEKLLFPGQTPLGQVLSAVASLVGVSEAPQRPTVPVTLLVWGVGRIVPVRITNYSIEEQQFLPSLYPIVARVSISMQVLTPDVFKCQTGPAVEIAKTAYTLFRKQQDALALAFTATNIDAIRGLLPF